MWSGGGWRRQAIAPPTHSPKITLPLGGERLSLTCPLSSHTPSSLQFRQVPSPGPINLVQNLFAGRGAYTIRHYEHKIKIATSAIQYSCSLRRTLICVTLMLQSGLGHKIQHFKFRYKGIGPRASGSWGGKGPPAGPPGAPRPWTGPFAMGAKIRTQGGLSNPRWVLGPILTVLRLSFILQSCCGAFCCRRNAIIRSGKLCLASICTQMAMDARGMRQDKTRQDRLGTNVMNTEDN